MASKVLSLQDIVPPKNPGKLYKASKLIGDLLMSKLARSVQIDTVLAQVRLAKSKATESWLIAVARWADTLQFHRFEWIRDNIFPLPLNVRPTSHCFQSQSTDFRLLETTDIQKVSIDLGNPSASLAEDNVMDVSIELTKEQEEKLLEDENSLDLAQGSREDVLEVISGDPLKISNPTVEKQSLESMKDSVNTVGEANLMSSKSSQVTEMLRRSPRKHKGSRIPTLKVERRECQYPQGLPKSREFSSPVGLGAEKRRHPEERKSGSSRNTKVPKLAIDNNTHLKSRICPVEGCGESFSRMHAMSKHIPGIFDDKWEPTEELTRVRISVLKICSSLILGTLDLPGLTRFVNNLRQIRLGDITVSKTQGRAINEASRLMGLPIPSSMETVPINTPALLIQWQILLIIFACMKDEDRMSLRDQYQEGPTKTLAKDPYPEAFDSHFHLDRTREVLKARNASMKELFESIMVEESSRVNLTGGTVVFCDPPSYPSKEEVESLAGSGFAVAVGIHPKRAKSVRDSDIRRLERLLTLPGVVALGEVGLDYSVPADHWAEQHCMLDKILQLLQPNHVLVLHCRGMARHTAQRDGCMMQLLYQLKGVVPKAQKIHLHCFSGSKKVVDRWISEFPETHFGFTYMVNTFDALCVEALKTLDEHRLLLETDSPYFKPANQRASTPALIGNVAKLVANLRGQSWEKILEVTRANGRRLYLTSSSKE